MTLQIILMNTLVNKKYYAKSFFTFYFFNQDSFGESVI